MSDELIPVRFSHVLGQSGVGAIVRGADDVVVVVQDTRQWTDRQGGFAGELIPYVERLRSALEISQTLREPPVARKLDKDQIDGACVPATRFPSWMRCPNCGALYQRPWKDAQIDDALRCHNDACKNKPRLEQVTWVLAHPAGHLGDVPWHSLAHQHTRNPNQRNCKVRDHLRLIQRGYDQRVLRCEACKAEASFRGDEHLPFGQGRMQPWTRDDLALPTGSADGEQSMAQVLTINDARLYASVTRYGLVIPPESRVAKGTVVDRLHRNSDDRRKIDNARTPLAKKSALKMIATEYRCTPKEIEAAMLDIERDYPLYGESFTPGKLKESEFEAFLEILPYQRDNEDLVTRNKSDEWRTLEVDSDLIPESKSMVRGIQHLVRVDRLKAVKVFMGFNRLGGDELVPPDIVGESDWLPAIQLYGEGVFIALDEIKLKGWEQHPKVLARLEKLQRRFVNSARKEPNSLTARFVLLHTLSHLLMRQIEAEGGYPAASLIERIYCSQAPEPMAGILIHVAVPDIAGSLGGLAELAEPRRFLGILSRALEHARWCSLDPVCSEHDGQGPELLNRAACHACTLVPEPACEHGNALLDRCFVKGDDNDGLPAFFGAP